MIHEAWRSSEKAGLPIWSVIARSSRIDGRAVAVIISSSPARKTPIPKTARRLHAVNRLMTGGYMRSGLDRSNDARLGSTTIDINRG